MRALVPDTRFAALYETLPDWAELDATLFANLHRHGDCGRWQAALDLLPQARSIRTDYGDVVAVAGELASDHRAQLREALQALHPWRKGPFDLFGVRVDAEWRSDLKWRRVAPAVDLAGAHVLDVGCGTGLELEYILERAPNARITAMEPGPADARRARAEVRPSDAADRVAGGILGGLAGGP